ncbi:unnamed protein product, partial [Prorocentrum cordatum]
VYASFAFVLTFGPDAHFRIDHPDHAQGLHELDAQRSGKPSASPPSAQDDGLVGGSVRVDPAAAPAGDHRRHSHHHSRHHVHHSHHGDHRSHHSSHHSSHQHRSHYEDGAGSAD